MLCMLKSKEQNMGGVSWRALRDAWIVFLLRGVVSLEQQQQGEWWLSVGYTGSKSQQHM